MQWNALKLLNENGEFLNDAQGKEVLAAAEADAYTFCDVMDLGHELVNTTYDRKHIEKVLALDLVDTDAISKANFTVAVDAVNSVGGTVISPVLKALCVENIIVSNCYVAGRFSLSPGAIPVTLTPVPSAMRFASSDV